MKATVLSSHINNIVKRKVYKGEEIDVSSPYIQENSHLVKATVKTKEQKVAQPKETKVVKPKEVKEAKEQYICDYCGKVLDTPQGRAGHMRFCKRKGD